MTGYVIADLPATMQSKIRVEGDCWVWTGARNRKGYGSAAGGAKNRSVLAHRKAYEATKGAIPEGLQIDHLCFKPACVNPAHLEAVTNAENTRRRYARGVTVNPPTSPAEPVSNWFARYESMTPDELAEHERGRRRLHQRLGCCNGEFSH